MQSNRIKTLLAIIASFFVLVSFQNCGQAGSIAQVTANGEKITEPLVADVINQIGVDPVRDVASDDDKDKDRDDDKDKDCDDKKDLEGDKRDHDGDKEDGRVEDERDHDEHVKIDDKKEDIEVVVDSYACVDEDSNEKKVLVCHVPPGNAAARHTICVSKSALKAHMNHGHKEHEDQDHLGECK